MKLAVSPGVLSLFTCINISSSYSYLYNFRSLYVIVMVIVIVSKKRHESNGLQSQAGNSALLSVFILTPDSRVWIFHHGESSTHIDDIHLPHTSIYLSSSFYLSIRHPSSSFYLFALWRVEVGMAIFRSTWGDKTQNRSTMQAIYLSIHLSIYLPIYSYIYPYIHIYILFYLFHWL